MISHPLLFIVQRHFRFLGVNCRSILYSRVNYDAGIAMSREDCLNGDQMDYGKVSHNVVVYDQIFVNKYQNPSYTH